LNSSPSMRGKTFAMGWKVSSIDMLAAFDRLKDKFSDI
jgi:hypothetical protein